MTETIKNALDKIKESGVKADEVIAETRKEAQKIIHEARLERERMIKSALEKVNLDSQKLKSNIEGGTAKEVREVEKDTKDQINALKVKAEANLNKALTILKEKIKS